MAKVLVVGGAGYVGSATCAWLMDQGHSVFVLDHLSTGQKELLLNSHFWFASTGDVDQVESILRDQRIDCVFHFAAKSLVSESVRIPEEYYDNNVTQTRKLLEAMARAGVNKIVFSSTCAIFGDPGNSVIHEDTPTRPQSPYGSTKLEAEKVLAEGAIQWGLHAIALRYFNAAGAEPQNRVGEWHDQETHLIPSIYRCFENGVPVTVYGDDYPTRDGTCIRDYIHVWDLAAAHGAAMNLLLARGKEPGRFEAMNLGSQSGYSVREVISAAEKVLGKKLDVQVQPRRPGDPPMLISGSKLAQKHLGFQPEKSDLETILKSAWAWEQKRKSILRPAVFLDRDGTLNDDPGYLNHPDQMKLLPGVGPALARLKAAGYRLFVASNQSGVGRGLINPDMIPKIHDRLQSLLKPWSVSIDEFALCFHTPNDQCHCRKPKPELILGPAMKYGIDLSRSYMVGDKSSDIEAGIAAKVKGSLLVRTGDGARTEGLREGTLAAFCGDTLTEVVDWILRA